MKRLNIVALAFSMFLFMNCKKSGTTPTVSNLQGTWHFKNVSGGIMGLDLDYDRGDVSWGFNEATMKLEVENNILTTGPKSIYARYQTGIYDYKITNGSGANQLSIDNVPFGIFYFENNSLKIDDGVAADGFLTTLNR